MPFMATSILPHLNLFYHCIAGRGREMGCGNFGFFDDARNTSAETLLELLRMLPRFYVIIHAAVKASF